MQETGRRATVRNRSQSTGESLLRHELCPESVDCVRRAGCVYIVASGPELADSPQSDCCRSSVFHTANAKPLASPPTPAMPTQKTCTQRAASLSTEATSVQGYLPWITAMCTASAGRTASALTQVDGRSVHSEFLVGTVVPSSSSCMHVYP